MKIVPSLSFPGTCRQAFEVYAEVLGGQITASYAYGDGPPEMPVPDQIKNWLMHCWLQVGDQALMGSDMHPDYAPDMNAPKVGFDVTLHTADKAEAERWFNALSEGGRPMMPFGESFWSPGFGMLTDKFGVPWMINTMPAADWTPGQG